MKGIPTRPASSIQRHAAPRVPFADRPIYDAAAPWKAADVWPAKWIHPEADWATPWAADFRCVFDVSK
ncbi:MAG: hypothetical protein ABW223_00575, partial [Rariglobus sp.]